MKINELVLMEAQKMELSDIKEFYKKNGAKFVAAAVQKKNVTVNGEPFFEWYDKAVQGAEAKAEKAEFNFEISPDWELLKSVGIDDADDLIFESSPSEVKEVFGAFSEDMTKIYIGFDCWFHEDDFNNALDKWTDKNLEGVSEKDAEKIQNALWKEYSSTKGGSILLVASLDGTKVGKFSIEMTSDEVISKGKSQIFYPSLYSEVKRTLKVIPFRLD